MKKIAIFTTTRAEFGIYLPLLKEIEKSKQLELCLFAGGTHLATEHGHTIDEISIHKITITDTFDYLLNEDSHYATAKSAGIATLELAHIFNKYEFDFVCVLGDRYELLSIIQPAIIYKKIIIHLHGGERTEGAIDEQIRHIVTKAAHIHFAACDKYAQNIIKMGENPKNVFNTGALAVDNMKKNIQFSKQELFEILNLKTDFPTLLMTYHPVTLEFKIPPARQIKNLFNALKTFNYQLVITAPNVDTNRNEMLKIIKEQINKNENYHYIESLGVLKYHNLLKYCDFVIGNSSSGIIEAPYFKIPTINIGDRQKGRLMHESVINVDYSEQAIINGIKQAQDLAWRNKIQNLTYKFGNENTAAKMVKIIEDIEINEKLMQKKLMFDE